MRETVGRDDAPILIDQEGGRVARLTPPQWRSAPLAKAFGDLALRDMDAAQRAAEINARLIAAELYDLGADVDCAGFSIYRSGAHDVIGDRSFGSDPDLVIANRNARLLMD